METKCASRDILTSVGLSGWRFGLSTVGLPSMEHASSVFSGQAGELVWAERELGVGGSFPGEQMDTGRQAWAGETDWAVEVTTFIAEVGFENLALLLN